jgi:hypothetical protein
MVKVLLFLGGLAILLVSFRQMFLMFRDGSFRARGNRLIVRNGHLVIFWMNLVGLVLFGLIGAALICWQLLT